MKLYEKYSIQSVKVPRIISSWSFVSSRATTAGRSPNCSSKSLSVLIILLLFSNIITVAVSDLRLIIRFFRPFFRGKNPSNMNRSVGSPDKTSAARTADGPRSASTLEPIAIASRTSLYAGSDIPGVPASDTTPRSWPEFKSATILGIRENSLCS